MVGLLMAVAFLSLLLKKGEYGHFNASRSRYNFIPEELS